MTIYENDDCTYLVVLTEYWFVQLPCFLSFLIIEVLLLMFLHIAELVYFIVPCPWKCSVEHSLILFGRMSRTLLLFTTFYSCPVPLKIYCRALPKYVLLQGQGHFYCLLLATFCHHLHWMFFSQDSMQSFNCLF